MTVLANALRQGNHHCPLSNSLSNLCHSTPNINKSGHYNLGSKFSVVMTKKELSMHNIAQGAHCRTVTSKRAAQYILLVGSQLCVHVRVSIVFGCYIFSRYCLTSVFSSKILKMRFRQARLRFMLYKNRFLTLVRAIRMA